MRGYVRLHAYFFQPVMKLKEKRYGQGPGSGRCTTPQGRPAAGCRRALICYPRQDGSRPTCTLVSIQPGQGTSSNSEFGRNSGTHTYLLAGTEPPRSPRPFRLVPFTLAVPGGVGQRAFALAKRVSVVWPQGHSCGNR